MPVLGYEYVFDIEEQYRNPLLVLLVVDQLVQRQRKVDSEGIMIEGDRQATQPYVQEIYIVSDYLPSQWLEARLCIISFTSGRSTAMYLLLVRAV